MSDKDGNVKHQGLRVLIRQNPTHSEHSDVLAEVFRAKNAKASKYQTELSHVSLVVCDTFGSEVEPPTEYSTSHLFTPRLRAALRDSGFDEVFLVTRDADGVLWHRPLRLLLLLEAFYVFGGALETYRGQVVELEPTDLSAGSLPSPIFPRFSSVRTRDSAPIGPTAAATQSDVETLSKCSITTILVLTRNQPQWRSR